MELQGPTLGEILQEQRTRRSLELEDLAGLTQLSTQRLSTLETEEEEPTFQELKLLSRILGVDLASYDPEEDSAPTDLPTLHTLTKSQDNAIPLEDWPTVIEAAEVAAEIVALERILQLPDRYDLLCRRTRSVGAIEPPAWRQGQRLAEQLRRQEGIGLEPIPSMIQWVTSLSVVVLEAYLPPTLSGLCIADRHHGPTLILNIQGHNESVFSRRFALAHELCHIFYDRSDLEKLERFDRSPDFFASTNKPPLEQRADAFSVHLLAPEDALRTCWEHQQAQGATPEESVRAIMDYFGLGFQSARDHLKGLGCLSREHALRLSRVPTQPTQTLAHAERLPSDIPALEPLAPMRRGALLALALEAESKGLMGTSKLLELLNIDGETLHQHRSTWQSALDELKSGVNTPELR